MVDVADGWWLVLVACSPHHSAAPFCLPHACNIVWRINGHGLMGRHPEGRMDMGVVVGLKSRHRALLSRLLPSTLPPYQKAAGLNT